MFSILLGRRILPTLFLSLLFLTLLVSSKTSMAVETGGLADNPIACRLASYGKFQDAAWNHLPSIGVKYLFMNVPKASEVDATLQKLTEHHLTALVMRGNTNLSEATCVEELSGQLEVCQRMGVKFMFLSPKRHGAPKDVIYGRLRQVGDIAKQCGVIVTLETHPDLGTNGEIHRETMRAIDHPNIRVNYDTANITYYNKGTDACTELKVIVDWVGTVELKDHNLEFETWNFPVLGEGKVNFPCILDVLAQKGYRGPITLEFEGIEGTELNQEETLAAIETSVEYARKILGQTSGKSQ